MRTPISGSAPRIAGRGRRFANCAPKGRKIRHRLAARRTPQALTDQIERYAKGFRLALQVLAREHSTYEDLLFAAPAIAVSLAGRRGPPAERGAALAQIRQGAPLVEVYATLELPFWLRKLPPEAFLQTPPHPFPQGKAAPDGEQEKLVSSEDPLADKAFGGRMLNLAPADLWGGWLEWACAARAVAGDDFALWLMSHRLRWSRERPEQALGPLAAYAWFSARPDQPAAKHLPRRWSSDLALSAALRDARLWLQRMLFEIAAPPANSPWRQPRKVRGYVFQPLYGAETFVEEGLAMRNCMASYAEAAAEGRCRIFAVRRGGRSIANLELRPAAEKGDPPQIVQLLGRGNRRASAASVRAVQEWSNQIIEEIAANPELPTREADPFAPPDLELWRAMLEPFLASSPAAGEIAPAMLSGPRGAFAALDAVRTLQRRAR